MECTGKKELVDQSYKILAHVRGPGATIPAYARLRFALLGSTWLPKSVGMLVWSALHVLLVVGGAPVLVFAAAAILVWCCLVLVVEVACVVLVLICWTCYALVAVTVGLIFELMARLSYSLLLESGRLDQIRAAFRSVARFVSELADMLGRTRKVISDLTANSKQIVYEMDVPRWWREWVGWCEEVMHMHDTIVI